MRSEALQEAQKRYSKKIIQFNIKYQIHEIQEGEALQKYIEENEESANKYVKRLIQEDLKKKGYIK